MAMSRDTAERAVTISAFVVAAVYAYRSFTEPSAPPPTVKKLAGVGELPPLGSWATAWGFMFLVIAIVTEAAPGLGAAFAILVATGDLLTNTSNLVKDVGQQGVPVTAGKTSSPPATRFCRR
jgi:hypothetical protein